MTRFLTVVFISFTFVAYGQKTQSIDKGKERLDKVCDTFMNLFVKGNTNDALQLLKQNSVMTPASIDTLQVTINNQMTDYFPAYGKILKAEFITEKRIKDFIAKRFYIVKFEKYYLKFDFTLYKASRAWTITSFKYDDELVELFH